MKIAIINDTHFGVRNGSDIFFRYQGEFFRDVFFPYCVKHNIKEIIHLGDFFDNRKHISIKALNFVRVEFLQKLHDHGIKMHIIPGNHCTYYKNTNELSSMYEVLQSEASCNVYMHPTVLDYDGCQIGLVPWISSDNYDECMDFIKSCPASILGGHFAISGFKYIANSNMRSEGMEVDLFDRYDIVLSGHYHTKNGNGTITYLGAQYQLTWSDVDDKKYFHVLDTETRELHPVENKNKLFRRYYYDDSNASQLSDLIEPRTHSRNKIHGNYVRIVVNKKKDFHLFDQFVQHFKDHEPCDLTIVENFDDIFQNEDGSDIEVVEDTQTLLANYIDKDINTQLNKKRLKKMFHELYIDAMNEETV